MDFEEGGNQEDLKLKAQTVINEKNDLIKQIFNYYDRKHVGKVSSSQIGDILRSCGFAPSNRQIKKLEENLKKQNLDFVDYDQFKKHVVEYYLIRGNELKASPSKRVEDAFKVLDKENKQYVLSGELKHALISLGETLKPEDVDKMFEKVGVKDYENEKLNL